MGFSSVIATYLYFLFGDMMQNFRIGELVKPVIFFKGVGSVWPPGKLINIHKKTHDDGSSDIVCYFVDMCHKIPDAPRVIRCCLVQKA